ncbi:lipopolysaccharide kinase InaA family protein [Escherichia coli]
MPVLGADREWNAIHRLRDVGVDTMYGVGIRRKRHESADSEPRLLLPKI